MLVRWCQLWLHKLLWKSGNPWKSQETALWVLLQRAGMDSVLDSFSQQHLNLSPLFFFFKFFFHLSTKPGCQPARNNNILTGNLMHPTRVIYIVWDPCASEITTAENKRITQHKGLDESKQEKRDLLLKPFPACSWSRGIRGGPPFKSSQTVTYKCNK